MTTTTTADYLFSDMPAPREQTAGDLLRRELHRLQEFTREHDGILYMAQAAVALGISKQGVQDLVERGQLPSITVFGRRVTGVDPVLARMDGLKGQPGRFRKAAKMALGMAVAGMQKE